MATRGYFVIKNLEDPKDVYLRDGDILVEAHHDGYFTEMVKDVLMVPFKMFDMHVKGYGSRFVSRLINEDTFTRYEEDLEGIKDILNVSLPIDMTWASMLELLHFTEPFKYSEIQPGVDRYGHPVDAGDSFFSILHLAERFDEVCLIIEKKDYHDEKEISFHEYLETGWGNLSLKEFLAKLNARIDNPADHIKFKSKTETTKPAITFSVLHIMANLIYQEKKRKKAEETLEKK